MWSRSFALSPGAGTHESGHLAYKDTPFCVYAPARPVLQSDQSSSRAPPLRLPPPQSGPAFLLPARRSRAIAKRHAHRGLREALPCRNRLLLWCLRKGTTRSRGLAVVCCFKRKGPIVSEEKLIRGSIWAYLGGSSKLIWAIFAFISRLIKLPLEMFAMRLNLIANISAFQRFVLAELLTS